MATGHWYGHMLLWPKGTVLCARDGVRSEQGCRAGLTRNVWAFPPWLLRPCMDLCRFLQDLGLPYEITVEDILRPSPIDMMVFVLYLHQTLPQFVPRSSIDFACKLGETQVGSRSCFSYLLALFRLSARPRRHVAALPHLSTHTPRLLETFSQPAAVAPRSPALGPSPSLPLLSTPHSARSWS
jgi:hypothetical protein